MFFIVICVLGSSREGYTGKGIYTTIFVDNQHNDVTIGCISGNNNICCLPQFDMSCNDDMDKDPNTDHHSL